MVEVIDAGHVAIRKMAGSHRARRSAALSWLWPSHRACNVGVAPQLGRGRCVCQKWRIARLYTFVCLFVLGTLPPGRNATLAWRLASASRARSDMLISIYSACLLHRAPALDTEHARSVAAHALLCATSHMPLYDHWETC